MTAIKAGTVAIKQGHWFDYQHVTFHLWWIIAAMGISI